ncbi:MAG: DUF4097 family beta strand repeat protein [Deferribacteres bacterium]|nr:DUF4097 family beta strand repeat protein [candidate division KSB1 bacterium]MCB9509824.1 DUF4097 family beta strand repeat protein [Deferribacteres bacterium]
MKMKSMIRIVAGVLLLASTLPGQEISKQGRDYVSKIEKTFTTQSGGTLILRDIQGDVHVSTWNQNTVRVLEDIRMDVFTEDEARKIVERANESYSQSGNTVTINGRQSRRYERHDFAITLPIKHNLEVNTSGGDIRVDGLEGEIDLGTSGGDIRLTKIKGNLTFRTSGGDIELSDIEAPVRGRTSGGSIDLSNLKGVSDLRTSGGSIRLDGAIKEVSLNTSGGEIDIRNASADVDASTSGGSVRISQSKGKLRLRTSGGDMRLSDLSGEIAASTSGGDIQGTTISGRLEVRTSGGDIDLRDMQAAVEASTSGGNVKAEITLTDFSKPHGVTLSTSGGDIEVTLPAKMPANILAEIRLDGRNRRYERYDIFSDFPLSKQKVEEDRYDIIRAEGQINGGGDMVQLETHGGNIYVKKGK